MLQGLRARLSHPAWRPGAVGAVAILGASLGFLSVLTKDAAEPTGYFAESPPSGKGEAANGVLSYSELREQEGAKRSLGPTAFEHLLHALPKVTDRVIREEGSRQVALAKRQQRRAYDGAPPVIPHAIDERDATSCPVCHERGMVLAGKTAPAISHHPMANCLQCHVPHTTSQPNPVGPELVGNAFTAQGFGGRGKRAFSGAPPVMPHRLLMRENCSSCHGVSGHIGIRTTHPERVNCQQCHAPDAAQQQLPPWLPPSPATGAAP